MEHHETTVPLVTVRDYSFAHDAHLARTKLESEGIPAVLQDEHLARLSWLHPALVGGVKLQVPAVDAERASAILAEIEREA